MSTNKDRLSGAGSNARAHQQAETDGAGGMATPSTVRWGAGIAIVQAIVVIGFGIFLAAQDFIGGDDPSLESTGAATRWVGVGTAIFILIVFGFVIAAAIAMTQGRKWGRGAVVLIEIILGASSFQMMSGGAVALGIATLLSALVVLYFLMLAPASTRWFAARF